MSDMDLHDISKAMKKIDICMMATRHEDGRIESRPMSNNKDVDYNGDSYFFALETDVVQDIRNDPQVCLSYQGNHHLYICISGKADTTQDKAAIKEHWVKDLEVWFEGGVDTPGLTLIHVKAEHLKYWNKMKQGEIHLNA